MNKKKQKPMAKKPKPTKATAKKPKPTKATAKKPKPTKATAKKPKPTKATAKKSTAKKQTARRVPAKTNYRPTMYGAWRYIKRAELLTYDHEQLPSKVIPEILSLTGFPSIEALMTEVRKHQRHHFPARLQKRLKRIFSIKIKPGAFDDRMIEWEFEGEEIKLPYPFKATPEREANVDIVDFTISEKKDEKVINMSIRIGAVTNTLPRRVKDRSFCYLVSEEVGLTEDLDSTKLKIISEWLRSNGVNNDIALRAAKDEDFMSWIETLILDRIEEFVAMSGASELGDDLILDGDEEKGFSR